MSNLEDIREKKTPITIGETTYNLLYDLNAIAELEEIYGNLNTAMETLGNGSVKGIINVLWAGLLHENESLTKKEVGKLFDLSNLPELEKIIEKSFMQSLPQKKETSSKKK